MDNETQFDGAQDLESMSTEQLEQHLDNPGDAAPANEQAPEEQVDQGGQDGGQQEQGEQLDPYQRMERRLDEIQREMGRFRGFQSRLDKFPQETEKVIQRILQQRERQAYLNSLSPEEREASEQNAMREQALRETIRREAMMGLQEQFGPKLQFIEQMEEQVKDQQYYQSAAQMAEQMAPGSSEGIADLFQKNLKDLNSQNPEVQRAALDWNQRALSSPEFLVLELMKAQSQKVNASASAFGQRKAAEGKALGAGIRSGQVKAVGRKPLEQYTEQELESMSVEDLEKLVP